MECKLRALLLTSGLLCCSGCFQPWSLRLPTCWTHTPEVERMESQYHDPFPDSQVGPDTGTRPLFYDQQRPLPVRIRERYDGTRIRGQGGAFVPPPVGTSPGSQYPQIVPY
ncbi:MAG: hypothetical protein KF861_04740 [Planctomycetaceae bacterium]|nr:hypothetical protein [Planctomycetaceae bacterium]